MLTQKMDTNVGIEFYVQRMIGKIERGRKKLIKVIFLSIFFSFDVRWSDVNAKMYICKCGAGLKLRMDSNENELVDEIRKDISLSRVLSNIGG